jgi:hypothetical protein
MSTEDRLGRVEEGIRELKETFREHFVSAQVNSLETAFTEFKSSTFPEFKSVMTSRFDSIAGNISDLKKLIGWLVRYGLAAFGALWVAVAFLYFQISNVDKAVTPISGMLGKVDASLRTISETVLALKASRDTGITPPSNIGVPLDEAQKDLVQKKLQQDLLQSIVRLWPAADKLTVGEVVSNPDVLTSVPEDVTEAIPALSGSLYTMGKTSILFVNREDHKVFAVVQRRG